MDNCVKINGTITIDLLYQIIPLVEGNPYEAKKLIMDIVSYISNSPSCAGGTNLPKTSIK